LITIRGSGRCGNDDWTAEQLLDEFGAVDVADQRFTRWPHPCTGAAIPSRRLLRSSVSPGPPSTGTWVGRRSGPEEGPGSRGRSAFGLEVLGLGELVFEDDDAAGRVQGDAVVQQGPAPGRPGVAGSGCSGGGRLRSAGGRRVSLHRGCAGIRGWRRSSRRPGPSCVPGSDRHRGCRC
jgi:hypothetical protein